MGKKTMTKKKKIVLIVLAICIVLAAPFIIFRLGMIIAVATNYSDLVQTDDGFDYLIRDPFKKASVCGYRYYPSGGNDVISIPESYGKYPVKEMGGYVGKGGPAPFSIDVQFINVTTVVGLSEDGSFDWYTKGKDIEIVYYDVTLNIGPNIREIYADQGGLEAGDKLYVVRVYVNCAPDNPKFFSKDGILYQKDGKAVEGFLYWNQSYSG